MSRFLEVKRSRLVDTTDQRMTQASQQLAAFNQSVLDIYANWAGYTAIEADAAELEAARVDFAAKTRELVDSRKAGLAQALDIISGGMRNAEGNPLTRQNLLDEIAAV